MAAVTPNINQTRAMRVAMKRIEGFAKQFGEAHQNLARHAAFPLVLTPDLLYQIWANFVPEAPWTAVAHVLLSRLCRQVGYEMYEIDIVDRNLLLRELKEQFGQERLDQLAEFLLDYVAQRLNADDPDTQDLREAQEWTALAYTRPTEVARELAEALSERVKQKDNAELFRLTSLVRNLAEPLLEAGFEPLLIYSLRAESFARGNQDVAARETFEFDIAKVWIQGNSSLPTLHTQEFEVEISRQRGRAQFLTEVLGSCVGMEMVFLPSGSFFMGSLEDELERSRRESPQHKVTVPSIFMGRYPITQAQWRVVAAMKQVSRELNPDPSSFKGDNRPVERVSWHDAVEFCARLSQHTQRDYRLPTEAEWEYACRAGTTTPFHFGKSISSELANYRGSGVYGNGVKGVYRGETTPVNNFGFANPFGLCDMHGNVFEWCLDYWHENYEGAPTDGSAWITDGDHSSRILRGGSWYELPGNCRSAYRYKNYTDGRYFFVGFRVVCASLRIE